MPVSELADWWDGERRQSERLLEEWVQDNPQWWAIGLATTASTAMELGAGMVDALRLGEGVAQGGVKGVAKDAMRLLVLVGPLAKAGGMLGRVAQTQMIRLAVTTEGVTGPCTFTAVNNAASIVSGSARNFFVTAQEAAQALGKPLAGLAKAGGKYKLGAWIDDLVPFLLKQGMRIRNLGQPASVADVSAAASSQNGVVVFAIEWADAAGKMHYHSMIAVRTLGGVRFADYGGKFISSLSELAARGGIWVPKAGFNVYTAGAKGSAVLFEGMEVIGALDKYAAGVFKSGMLLLEGMQAIETPDGVDVAFPVSPAAVIVKQVHEPDVLKRSFEAYKARRQGKTVVRMPEIVIKGRRNGPPPSEWLTGVQYRLNVAGFGAGAVDGINGPRTERAIRKFQHTYELKCDGIPGPLTQRRLVEVCGF